MKRKGVSKNLAVFMFLTGMVHFGGTCRSLELRRALRPYSQLHSESGPQIGNRRENDAGHGIIQKKRCFQFSFLCLPGASLSYFTTASNESSTHLCNHIPTFCLCLTWELFYFLPQGWLMLFRRMWKNAKRRKNEQERLKKNEWKGRRKKIQV